MKKEIVRVADGISLIAKETIKRSQTINKTHSDFSSFFTFSLKNALLPVTDLLGLTSGKIREIPTNPIDRYREKTEKSELFSSKNEQPICYSKPDSENLGGKEDIIRIRGIPASGFDRSGVDSEKSEIFRLKSDESICYSKPDFENLGGKEEIVRIRGIPANGFDRNGVDLEKSEFLRLENEGNKAKLENFVERGELFEKPIGGGRLGSDESLSGSGVLSSFDGDSNKGGRDRVDGGGVAEIGDVKVGLNSLDNGSNVVDNVAKNVQVGVDLTIPKKQRRPRERRVPSTPFSRALGFAGLGAGLAWGTFQESTKRLVYGTNPQDKQSAYSPFLSEKNAERLALALCRMRGAALKIGQMLSIQDESLIPPPILAALDIVRQGADVMPKSQLDQVLGAELGPNWSSKLINFDYAPLASASIGQVHKAVTEDGVNVAVKIQYPGVADSIESDIENVKLLLNYTNLIPKGLFLDSAIKVAKQELSRECDYELEAANQKRFREFLSQTKGFYVPMVMDNISSKRVITTELVSGIPIDKVASLSQETRNYVGRKMLELTLMELFVFRFMQTDPNWSNFLFDETTNTINLIDFGAARDFPQVFVDNYLRMVMACANSEREPVLEMSKRLGFLTGMESEIMLDAHVQASFVVGLPFSKPGLYDFRSANITQSISNLGATMLRHRLTPPPDEAYSLHRKLAGAFLACIKIGAVVPCRDLLLEVYKSYRFGEDADCVVTGGSAS